MNPEQSDEKKLTKIDEDHAVRTSCQGCCFSENLGKTQVGCSLNKIRQFKDNGINVIEATDEDGNEFFVVERFCHFYRDHDWEKAASKYESPEKRVRKEVEISCGFIVLHGKDDSKDDITKTLTDIANQKKIYPTFIVVGNNSSEVKQWDMWHICKELFDESITKINVVKPFEEMDDLNLINECFPRVRNGYYSVFRSGNSVPTDLIQTLDKCLNDKMKQIAMIKSINEKEIDGLTIQCVMHKFMHGNGEQSVEEKLSIFAEMSKREHFIKTWDECRAK